MKQFTFDVFHASGTEELRERLNEAGQDGFEIKQIFRMDEAPGETWVAVVQREGVADLESELDLAILSPKGENL